MHIRFTSICGQASLTISIKDADLKTFVAKEGILDPRGDVAWGILDDMVGNTIF